MSDLRSVKLTDYVVRWIATVSVVILAQCTFGWGHSSWADSASTNGTSAGNVSGSSDTSANVSSGAFSDSHAASVGSHHAKAHTATGSWQNADIPTRRVKIETGAEATAASNERTLTAKADAWADGTAGDTSKSNSSGSVAISSDDGQTAGAWSSDGSYANATSGSRKQVSAYTPSGNLTVFKQDKFRVALSYEADGHFSLAIAGRRDAQAYVGQTKNLRSLDNRNIKSILQSVMSASALASLDSVSAFARSELAMTFADARSEASARGMSEAYASVRRDRGKLVVTVRASENGGCASAQKSSRSTRHDCMVVTKLINLKKSGHFKVTARAGSHHKKSRRHRN